MIDAGEVGHVCLKAPKLKLLAKFSIGLHVILELLIKKEMKTWNFESDAQNYHFTRKHCMHPSLYLNYAVIRRSLCCRSGRISRVLPNQVELELFRPPPTPWTDGQDLFLFIFNELNYCTGHSGVLAHGCLKRLFIYFLTKNVIFNFTGS